MTKKVLLITDMLNDFVKEDGALTCGQPARDIIPFIRNKIKEIHDQGGTVIYLADSHAPDDREFSFFPPHCLTGSTGAEIIDELPVDEKDIIIKKTRYSGFYATELEKVLAGLKPDEVHVVGVCTSICVMDTVSGLRDRDYITVVHKNGVADFDEEAHRFSLKRMEKVLGAKVV